MRKQALFVGDLGALKDLGDPERWREMLRLGIIAELDAVNLYTQMSELAEDTSIKKIMIDIAKEEKTHAGEFQALLERIDKEYAVELDAGKKEVEDKTAGYNRGVLVEKMAMIANGLDDFGFVKDASVIDGMMRKVAFFNMDNVADNLTKIVRDWSKEQQEKGEEGIVRPGGLDVRELIGKLVENLNVYIHDKDNLTRLALSSSELTYVKHVVRPALQSKGGPWGKQLVDKLPHIVHGL